MTRYLYVPQYSSFTDSQQLTVSTLGVELGVRVGVGVGVVVGVSVKVGVGVGVVVGVGVGDGSIHVMINSEDEQSNGDSTVRNTSSVVVISKPNVPVL